MKKRNKVHFGSGPYTVAQAVEFLLRGVKYLEAESLVIDRGDGQYRFKTREEINEELEILGGNPQQIAELITSIES